MIDVPLLRKALEYVTANPDSWDQQQWLTVTDCGTVGCLAGWVVVLNDDPVTYQGDRPFVVTTDGEFTSVEERARRLLMLNVGQAFKLFHPFNSLRDLWRIAAELTDDDVEVPTTLPTVPPRIFPR